jgi:hypothetical protein
LWQFSGFSGGFSQVPVLAPILADAISGEVVSGAAGDSKSPKIIAHLF